jgi:hypothetical protein
MSTTSIAPAAWPRDESFILCPLEAVNETFPAVYPGIYALLHIDGTGRETLIHLDESSDVRWAVAQARLDPQIIHRCPTHVAVQHEPARTPEEYLARQIDTVRYRVKFRSAA